MTELTCILTDFRVHFACWQDLTDEPLLRLQETISSDIADQVYIENLRVQTTEWGVWG